MPSLNFMPRVDPTVSDQRYFLSIVIITMENTMVRTTYMPLALLQL